MSVFTLNFSFLFLGLELGSMEWMCSNNEVLLAFVLGVLTVAPENHLSFQNIRKEKLDFSYFYDNTIWDLFHLDLPIFDYDL